MTNEEWRTLLFRLAWTCREQLGMDVPCIEFGKDAVPAPPISGVITEWSDVSDLGEFEPGQKKVKLRRFEPNEPTAVDLPARPDRSVDQPIQSLEELAAFTLLHELGHHAIGHDSETVKENKEANHFALAWLSALLEAYHATEWTDQPLGTLECAGAAQQS